MPLCGRRHKVLIARSDKIQWNFIAQEKGVKKENPERL